MYRRIVVCRVCNASTIEGKTKTCCISNESYCLPCADRNLKKCTNCDELVDQVYLDSKSGVCTECITG